MFEINGCTGIDLNIEMLLHLFVTFIGEIKSEIKSVVYLFRQDCEEPEKFMSVNPAKLNAT